MPEKYLELATRYAEQIMQGEILPKTMLNYMIEIEDGGNGSASLFDKANIREEDGYIAIGYAREELYLHIVSEALGATGTGRFNIEVAEKAYARATNSPRKHMNYTDIPDILEDTAERISELQKEKNTSFVHSGGQDIPTADL